MTKETLEQILTEKIGVEFGERRFGKYGVDDISLRQYLETGEFAAALINRCGSSPCEGYPARKDYVYLVHVPSKTAELLTTHDQHENHYITKLDSLEVNDLVAKVSIGYVSSWGHGQKVTQVIDRYYGQGLIDPRTQNPEFEPRKRLSYWP